MRFFVKAVATGFAMSLGSALFRKVSKKIGLDTEGEATPKPEPETVGEEGQPEPQPPT